MLVDNMVEFLEAQGASYVFGVPGSTTVSLINSISGSKKLKFVSALHENASVAMADGYSRASGKFATVVLHTTPGLSSALPNLYNSFVDKIPLLVLVGDVNSKALIKQPGLSLDRLEDLAKPVTRWCYYAKSPSDVLTALARSARILTSPQTGPCCIIVPEDILEQETPEKRNHHTLTRALATVITPNPDQMSELVTSIDDAKWPVLIVGREVRGDESIRSLVSFCERLCVPVLLESPYPSAYCANFPMDSTCYLGLFRRESEVMKDADLVVGLGGQLFTERKFYEDGPFENGRTKVMHIQANPWELGKNIATDVAILGTPDNAALMLEKASRNIGDLKGPNRKSRLVRIEQIHAERMDERSKLISRPSDGCGIKPWRLVNAIYEVLRKKKNGGYTIVDEGVVTSSYLAELFVFTDPASLIGRSAGCLGWGIGAAIGAKLALPKRKVVAFVGDGALMFCPQGLWTAAHYDIPITVIVCNNSGYASVELSYDSFGKRVSSRKVSLEGTEIDHPPVNIVELAKSLGVDAVSVEEEDKLFSTLEKNASSSDVLELIDVHTDPNEKGYEGSVGQNSVWT